MTSVPVRGFRVAGVGAGAVNDYRFDPALTLCGKVARAVSEEIDLPLCGACERREGYPTEAEFLAYWTCTDCGVDTWALGEALWTLRDRVWDVAYPRYRSGAGVGCSRPCIGCLERRLGRTLTSDDFVWFEEGQISSQLRNRTARG